MPTITTPQEPAHGPCESPFREEPIKVPEEAPVPITLPDPDAPVPAPDWPTPRPEEVPIESPYWPTPEKVER